MIIKSVTFAYLDRIKGIPPLEGTSEEEMPLPAWYRYVHNTPLGELSVEDLCKAVRQRIHPEEIVALAVEHLETDPLVGEMFDGELLASLKSVDSAYWENNPKMADRVKLVVQGLTECVPEDVHADGQEIMARLHAFDRPASQ